MPDHDTTTATGATMEKHTKTPWRVQDTGLTREIVGGIHRDRDGEVVTSVCRVYGNATSNEVTSANAARIVACVNAMAGIADPSVVPELVASCKELRDALAAALRVMVADDSAMDSFEAELLNLGIAPGFGVRADKAIAAATSTPAAETEGSGR